LKIKNALADFMYSQVTEYNIGNLVAGYYGGEARFASASQIHVSAKFIIDCRKLELLVGIGFQ
jgi:hypothetical protein